MTRGIDTSTFEQSQKERIRFLIRQLDYKDQAVRIKAIKLLGKAEDPDAVEPLIALLEDQDEDIRYWAAESLGIVGEARAVDPLIALLSDPHADVRSAAAAALGEIEDPAAVRPLVALLRDEYKEVRFWAAEALGRIHDTSATASLIEALEDEVGEVRTEAAYALGRIGDASAIPALKNCLYDDYPDARQAAEESLEALGGSIARTTGTSEATAEQQTTNTVPQQPDLDDGEDDTSENLLDRSLRLFEYLIRFQQQRTAPVRRLESYNKGGSVVWFYSIPDHEAVASALNVAKPAPSAPLLIINRIPRLEPPELPEELSRFVEADDLRDTSTMPVIRKSFIETQTGDDGEIRTTTHSIEDEPHLVESADRWLEEWKAWAQKEQRALPVRALYQKLFQISQQAADSPEDLELVCGLGCLSWRPEEHQEVRRHLLTCPIEIMLDDQSGQISVHASEETDGLTIEMEMLDSPRWPDASRFNEIKEEAKSFEHHILDEEEVSDVLIRLANNIDPNGRYEENEEPANIGIDAVVSFAPAIILRRRSNVSLLRIFRQIKTQLEMSKTVPNGIKQLLEVIDTSEGQDSDRARAVGVTENYLPLPANKQQLEIVNRVNSRNHTVVQGPPGTGKTHTIANLLAHLLANGKRVLVTAHTDRALRELREKLPKELEALCVSIVGRERTDLADLKVAVEALASRAAEYDAHQTAKKITRLEEQLDTQRRELSRLHNKLITTREKETIVKEFEPYKGTLAQISIEHQAYAESYSWLRAYSEDIISDEAPLSDSEIREWLSLCKDPVVLRDESEATQDLLDLPLIPRPEEFARLVETYERCAINAEARAKMKIHAAYASISRIPSQKRTELGVQLARLSNSAKRLEDRPESWIDDALQDIYSEKPEVWVSRNTAICHQLFQCKSILGRTDPTVSIDVNNARLDVLLGQAVELKAYVEAGGKIRHVLKPKPVKNAQELTESVLVNGLPPVTIETLCLFVDWVTLKRSLDYLDSLWPEDMNIPSEDTFLERYAWHTAEANQLAAVVDYSNLLRASEDLMQRLGMPRPSWRNSEDIQEYTDIIGLVSREEAVQESLEPISKIENVLREIAEWPDAPEVIRRLIKAIRERKPIDYHEAYERIDYLKIIRKKLDRRDQLGSRLIESIPKLVDDVIRGESNEDWEGKLSHLSNAWNWCKAEAWLKEETEADVDTIQRKVDATEDRIRKTITELTSTQAWSLAVGRLGLRQKLDLRSYVLALRKLGKGTGKYASHRKAEARASLRSCHGSVPAWIMPIYRIAETLDIERNMFDVVIIDEASQAGVEAAFLQYMAPKIVAVGDDKQVSPSGIGLNYQHLIDLRKQLIPDLDHGHVWENPTASFFDLAQIRYGDVITLQEHFRCVPEIIGFSNRIAYEPHRVPLIPLRQYGTDRLEPIMPIYIEDGYVNGRSPNIINPPEVDRIVETILNCCEKPEYDGKTMGVISLTGHSQAASIEQKLISLMDLNDYKARELRCGDSADFQGSERDVMFLSMVVKPEDGKRMAVLVKEDLVQRFNVAGSRAKDQMWVFHSVRLDELNNKQDMRFQLLDYCYSTTRRECEEAKPGMGRVAEDVPVDPFDSLFEQQVYNRIIERGYTVVPQLEIYGYRIDLVVVGGHSKLAVECDGDSWHGPDKYEEDMGRQRELERCGWKFYRVRASAFYSDAHKALEGLWEQLETHEIFPRGRFESPAQINEPQRTDSSLETRHAEELESLPERIEPPRIQTVDEVTETNDEGPDEDQLAEDEFLYDVGQSDSREEQSKRATTDVKKSAGFANVENEGSEASTYRQSKTMNLDDNIKSVDDDKPFPEVKLDPNGYFGAGIMDVPIGLIPLQIALLVKANGKVEIADLGLLFEERYGIQWGSFEKKWLKRFAWSAVGHKFVKWDESQTVLLPGQLVPHIVEPPGSWTYSQMCELATRLRGQDLQEDELFEHEIREICGERRAPRLIARLIGSAIRSSQQEPLFKEQE